MQSFTIQQSSGISASLKARGLVTHNLSLLSLTFGKLDSSYTRSISAVSCKSLDKLVFYEGLGLFLVCVHFCSSTFFWALHVVCLQNTFISSSRWRTAAKENKATTSQNVSHWNFKRKKFCTNTVHPCFFSVYSSILWSTLWKYYPTWLLDTSIPFSKFSTLVELPIMSRKLHQRWNKKFFSSLPRLNTYRYWFRSCQSQPMMHQSLELQNTLSYAIIRQNTWQGQLF